jgi:uncharacterized protein involved in propanediol utilization
MRRIVKDYPRRSVASVKSMVPAVHTPFSVQPSNNGHNILHRLESRIDVGPVSARRTCIAQHGELLQGQIRDRHDRHRRFLISLPCNELSSTVTFAPALGRELTVEPAHKLKLRKAVEITLAKLGIRRVGGLITVKTNIKEGKGYGGSTADCVAGTLAAADAMARTLTEEEVAELVVTAEIASDNLMFSRAILFAHREGVVLEDLGRRFPHLEVLGVDTDADGVVNTLEYTPAEYDQRQINAFGDLVTGLRKAVQDHDLALLGRVATSSALINEQFLPKLMFSDLRRLAECVGALGIAVAHSGTVLSILFDPSDPKLENRMAQAQKELEKLGIRNALRFRT